MTEAAPQGKGINKERARSGLSRLQAIMGILLLLSAASGFYLLATDASLWLLALSHAVGLIVVVGMDIVLGLMNLASSRRVYIPSLAAAVLAVALQLGDILTAPQYNQSAYHFAQYLFGLGAFDLLLGLQVAVIVLGVVGRPYASYLARRKSRRGRELEYTRRGFVRSLGILAGLIGVAAVLSSVKLPVPKAVQTTTTLEPGTPSGAIARVSSMKVGTPVYFEYPSPSYPCMLFLRSDGNLFAVSILCTHICCTCEWDPSVAEFYCPCHGSIFDSNGTLLSGPAYTDLPQIELRTDSNGYVYPTGVSSAGPCQV